MNRRGLEQQVNEMKPPGDWSDLGGRILEVAAAATAIHLSERAAMVQRESCEFHTNSERFGVSRGRAG